MKCDCGKQCKGESGLKIHKARYCTLEKTTEEATNNLESISNNSEETQFIKGARVQHRLYGDRFTIEYIAEDGRIARRVNARPDGIKFYKEKELELL